MKTRISTAWLSGLVVAPVLALMPDALAQITTNRTPTATEAEVIPPASARAADTADKPDQFSEASAAPVSQRLAVKVTTTSGEDQASSDLRNSYWTSEVMKLAQAGIDDDVLLSFIDSVGSFNLSASDIIELNDLGASGEIITAMIRHDTEVAAGLRIPTASASLRTIHITVTPQSQTPVRSTEPATLPTAAQTASVADPTVHSKPTPATDTESPAPKLSTAEYSLASDTEPMLISSPATTARESKRLVYAVREPYPEELLPPIVVIRAVGPSPNVLVVEWSP